MKILMIIFLISSLLGCATTTYYEKPGASDADFKRDNYECERDVRGLPYSPYSQSLSSMFMDEAIRLRLFEQCMEAKGWRKVKK